MATFEWYEKLVQFDSFEQGDFFDNVPIPILTKWDIELQEDTSSVLGGYTRYDLVMMTQSCDLLKIKDPNNMVVLCPRLAYPNAAQQSAAYRSHDGWTKLRTGRIIGAHLLSKCEIDGHHFDFQVVNLQQVISVPFGYLKDYCRQFSTSRIRLLPPYREHLAQAFTRQFMRVGLPILLPDKYPASSE